MSLKNIKSNNQGFTIVELLIVVVVIAILAAITIVSYNGITGRANNSSAKSAAANVAKKVEAFAAEVDTTGYPTQPTALTGSTAAGKTYQLNGVTFVATPPTTAPNPASTVVFYRCGTAAAAAATTLATVTVVTGTRVGAWDYETGTFNTSAATAGQVTGNSAGGYSITCYPTAS